MEKHFENSDITIKKPSKKKRPEISQKKKRAGVILTVIVSIMIIHALLITAFDTAVYGTYDFYENEYKKYNVMDNLNMTLDDTMTVTKKMMPYLIGKRESLDNIKVPVAGEVREFFNEDEKSHMKDVQRLFLLAFASRNIALIIALLILITMNSLYIPVMEKFPKIFRWTALGYVIVMGVFGGAVALNFNKVFVIFHEVAFTNDNWLFDPATSLMINMLPEGLFFDVTKRILMFFFLYLIIAILVSIAISYLQRRKRNLELN